MSKTINFSGMHVLILEGYARQCLPFLREFKKLGCEVTLLCNSKIDSGYLSRLPDHKVLGICDPDHYEESEKYIIELVKNGDYDLVFPLVDFSAKILANNKTELSKYAFIACNDKEVFECSQDKLEVMRVCMDNGISHPKTIFNVTSIDDVLNSGLIFPIIIKPRHGCGARGFRKFQNERAFVSYVNEAQIDLSKFVVQECIPVEALVATDNIFIDDSGCIKSSYQYGCYRVFPIQGGTGTFNITFDRADIHAECAKLVQLLRLRGCVGVDLMIDPRDNKGKVIEVNPRVLACSKIGFLVGVNQAQQLLEQATGHTVTPYMTYKSDMRIRMSQTDLLWFIKSPNRFRTKPSWFSQKNTRDQMFSWDDPLPWFAFLICGIKNYKSEMAKRQSQ